MKKLLTVTKSKFYMLRVNFPQAFEHVQDSKVLDNHDPLAERKRDEPTQTKQQAGVELEDEDSEANRLKREEVLKKD